MTSTEKEPASRALAFAWVIGAYVVAIGVAMWSLRLTASGFRVSCRGLGDVRVDRGY